MSEHDNYQRQSCQLSASKTNKRKRASANLMSDQMSKKRRRFLATTLITTDNRTDSVVYFGSSGQASYQKNRTNVVREYNDSGNDSCICIYCGACFWLKEALKESLQKKNSVCPIYTGCCHKGEVKLPQAKQTPLFLQQLLDPTNSRESVIFRENIRVYNSMFAFTSMGANIMKDINIESGPYIFKICGQIHHRMGFGLPLQGECPKYAQLYIYDTNNEISNRIRAVDPSSQNKKTQPHIVKGLIDMFDRVNKLAQDFRNLRDKQRDGFVPSYNMTMLGPQPTDSKQYELQTNNEIAGLIVGDIGEFDADKDIVIESHDRQLKRVSRLDPKYMALQYPLLFPFGEDGWALGLVLETVTNERRKTRTNLTMGKYISYQIHDRKNYSPPLLKGGRLFQQYLVDAYATVEENNLYYIRINQGRIRSENKKEIYEAVSSGISEAQDVGNRIILPSSYTGCPRDMMNNYQDAMAICRQYGNPDLFITFTCNVKWPEISRYFQNNPGYKPEDRPDIVSRIFKLKLDDMLAYIISGEPFGKIDAHVYTIEFQKRGLPHSHLLFWLEKSFKCYSATDVDSIISAELPDKTTDPKLFEIVSQSMIHGPCGRINSKAPCMPNGKMSNGKCSKFFPKDYNTETTFEVIKPPVYKRRNDPTKFTVKNGITISNNFVVPYNSDLLLRYNAHINVESCSQSMLIKYLFKYLNKGTDRTRVMVHQNEGAIDEIKTYLNCRHLAPHESVWRLLEFSIHARYPAILLLKIHLQAENVICFKDTDSLQSIMDNPISDITMFTRWFEKNQDSDLARTLTYAEFPTKFVWNSKQCIWTVRKQYKSIGRIPYIPPIVGELYYMKLLLNVQRGCRNYAEIRTVRGVLHDSYRNACVALGLLDDDNAWLETLTESSLTATSSQIRKLFVTLLLFCDISDPQVMLDTHWQNMGDDILYKVRLESGIPNLMLPESELKNNVLFELENLLTINSSSLRKFGLPMPDANKILELHNRLMREELDYDHDAIRLEHQTLIVRLNVGQRIIYDQVLQSIEKKNPQCFFVHGSGGTGKTFLWHTIISKLRSEAKIVLAVASSGIASLLLPNGRTAHSRFSIPLNVDEKSQCKIKKGKHLARLLERTSLIIWDEAPMTNKYCFEALHRSLTIIFNTSQDLPSTSNAASYSLSVPFGGRTMLLGGDFRQILPVVPGGSKENIIQASLNNSFLWPHFTIFHLTENMRLARPDLSIELKQNIAAFGKWVLDVGEGRLHSLINTNDPDTSWINIPSDLLTDPNMDPIRSIFSSTYPNFNERYNNSDYLRERAIVTPRNVTVHAINNYATNMIPGDETRYYSFDTISSTSRNYTNLSQLYPIEFLNKLEFSGFPTHELVLKIGMPIMLLRNLNSTDGLCNGTRLIVTNLFNRLIEAQILTGRNIGDTIYIPRIALTTTETKWPFIFKRRQFPIRPCYAMTINKSQGQSLNYVGIYLSEPVFTHGQLYVALSRVTSKEGLRITIDNSDDIPNNYTKNIVYKDVLHNL